MNHRKLVLFGLLALSACKSPMTGKVVQVIVTNPSSVAGIVRLQVGVSSDVSVSESLTLPESAQTATLAFPVALSIPVFSSRSARMDITIQALDARSSVVATGATRVYLTRSSVTAEVALRPAGDGCDGGPCDTGFDAGMGEDAGDGPTGGKTMPTSGNGGISGQGGGGGAGGNGGSAKSDGSTAIVTGGNNNAGAASSGGTGGSGGSTGGGTSTSGSGGSSASADGGRIEDITVPPFEGIPLPCEVIAKDPGGARCVAAHSTVRAIVPGYAGPLYQLCRGGSVAGPSSCKGETIDVMANDGYAAVATHEAFCLGESCTVTKIYDQSGKGNDLEPAPQGGAKPTPDNPAKADVLPVKSNGHRAYGILIKSGMGYRTGCGGCTVKKGNGMALGDAPQSIYMITSQKDLINACCFDYGNAETTSNADDNGAIEAVYFGGGVVWGTGDGGKLGPWVMADLENGLYAGWQNGQDKGISTNMPLKFDFVTAVLLGDTGDKNGGKGRFVLYGADASGVDATYGKMTTMYDGIRPERDGYVPMKKQGSVILGTSGDNSSAGGGRFYEGAIAIGPVLSKSTAAYLQAVIVAAKYESP